MGTAASSHTYECQSSGIGKSSGSIPCVLTGPATCSICTGEGLPSKSEDEEVLVEPCSILEELGFLDTGFAKVVSAGRTDIPPSPRGARDSLGHRSISSPTASFSSAPHMGSPSFALCPPPLADAESPGSPDVVPFEAPVMPMPMPVLPDPTSPSDNSTRHGKCWGATTAAGQRYAQGLSTRVSVDLDADDVPLVTPRMEEDNGGRPPSISAQAPLVTPPTSPLACTSPPPAVPLEMADDERRSRPWKCEAPADGRPWSPRPRSPYRGGVLSLFTPSPPSPPRRPQIHSEEVPESEVKDLDEDAQIAMAVAASLQEAAPKPPCAAKHPKQSPRTVSRALLAVARPFRKSGQRVSMSI